WHWSEAVHTTGFVPTQAPAAQASVCVHALPSVQGVPSTFVGLLQVPVAGSQVPAVWHWSEAVHTRGIVPTQAPAAPQAACVHALPSAQAAAAAWGGLLAVPAGRPEAPAGWAWP